MITREHLIQKLKTAGYEVEDCGPKLKATRGRGTFWSTFFWITIGDVQLCVEMGKFPYAHGYFLRGNSMILWMEGA